MPAPAHPPTQAQPAAAARRPPADPMKDPVQKKQVEAARDVAYHLLKGIKQIGMYRHAEAKFAEFLPRPSRRSPPTPTSSARCR